ncbi:hypothetical protein HPP92_025846 [Vanilla planifolia]|uniref:Phosphoglycolate phosphatase n=1 Tax=Vanilla planifolia TaxID=51239 RepID=A0A835PFF6_VANPL|nr:hypothetical protein HPP92_025846 [Vanilla planifolia]
MAKGNDAKITDREVIAIEKENMVNVDSEKSSTYRSLTSESAKDLIESVDAFLFDCDGVIWKGDKLIDGVPEALQALRSMGKRLVFVTNNSTKSRKQYARKFGTLGLHVTEEEIFSSSFAAAMFLKLNGFSRDKKVYVIGEEGILEELELAGFTGLGGPNPGCLFIATNRDAVGHLTDLQEWPGAGCMVAAVCGSVQKEPVVVGKPSTFLMDFLLERYKIDTSKMCMVGDRLDTDILFGRNAGCKTLLVLSGVTALSDLNDSSNTIHPDYYTSNVSDIVLLCRK